MTKIIKKSKKLINKNYKKKSMRSRRLSNNKQMKGGDGRYVLPPAYFNNNSKGYFQSGSSELSNSSNQHSVSNGVIWDNGLYAGPNLYPSMKGGNCGCNSKRNKQSSSRKSKSRKSKSRK